jgi:hypothetical protein
MQNSYVWSNFSFLFDFLPRGLTIHLEQQMLDEFELLHVSKCTQLSFVQYQTVKT